MSDAKRKLYLAAQRDALFVAACDAMDEPTCDHHGPWGCKDCPAWEAFKIRHAAAARPSPRGTGTEAVERVCPACGETPSAARERWAKIAARPDFDPEGAPTPCDHAALRRGTGTEGGK